MADDSTTASFPDPTELSDGEFAKSQGTRTNILMAALECLATRGYSATTLSGVAKQAGLSRTAVLYHFSCRQALIDAVVQFVTRRRVELQQEIDHTIPKGESALRISIDASYDQLGLNEFIAYCELNTAARTDQELARVFDPSHAAFDKARREMSRNLAEDAKVNTPGFDLRCDITRFLLEGIVQQNGLTFNKDTRLAEIKSFLEILWADRYDSMVAEAVDRAK